MKGIFGLLIKVLIIVAIIAVGIIIYQTCAGSPIVQRIDQMVPDIEKVPFEVITRTKVYYAASAIEDKGAVIMSGWYEKIDGKWVYHTEEITLPPILRPQIIKRN